MPTKTVSLLADRDCARIHDSALRLLQSVGVHVANDEACHILRRAGARVDEGGVVRVPPQLVQEALSAAPRKVELAGEGYRFCLPSDYTHYASRVKYPRQQAYPPTTDHVPTRQDIVNNCRLANALPLVKAVFVLDGPTADFDERANWLLTPATVLSNSPKHVISPSIHLRSAQYWAEMAEAASDSGDLKREPRLTIMVSPHGPLRLDSDTADVMLFAVRRGIPVSILPIPMAGVTSPVTLAGTLAVGAAEALFMITLAQVVSTGAPALYAGDALTFNMRTGAVSLGDPEAALFFSAEMAMAHFYGLPSYLGTGFTDSYYPDVQAGAEKALTVFVSLASGADLVTVGGALGAATIVSCEQIVIDHDIFEAAQRVTREIEVNEDTLALEVIEEIGHRGGEYLSHPHTLRWLRTGERYFGGTFDRAPGMDESRAMLQAAHRRVEEILERSPGGEVSPAAIERVRSYVREQKGPTVPWL